MKTKEAIERVRARFDKWGLDEEDLRALRALGLVSIESEDERIRERIICRLKYDLENNRNKFTKREIPEEIAWLEKQKAKERLDRMAPIYNDKELFESALEKAWKYYNESASRTVDSFEDDYIECVFSKGFREGFLYKEKQKEQKSAECITDSVKFEEGFKTGRELGFREGVESVKPAECLKPEKNCWYVCIKDFYAGGKKQCSNGDLVQAKGGMYMMGRDDISEWFRKAYYDEIKPAEWSEEDNKMLSDIVKLLKVKNEKFIPCDAEESWLNELPNRFNLQQKQEWSDEDEENFKWFDKLFRAESIVIGGKDIPQDKYLWFKSLCPQPHWKPSEEQIGVLYYAYCEVFKRKDVGHKILDSFLNLIDDLRKL